MDGLYTLGAAGGQSGDDLDHAGGRGALVGGTLELKAGDLLDIEVGGRGGEGDGAAGGGGSFFYDRGPATVPEPASLALFAIAAPALFARRRREH